MNQTDHSAIVISTFKAMGFKASKAARGKMNITRRSVPRSQSTPVPYRNHQGKFV